MYVNSDDPGFEGGDLRLKHFLNRKSLPIELYRALTREGVTYENLEFMAQYDMDNFCTKHKIPLGVKLSFKKAVDDHQMELHEEHYQPQPGEKLKRDDKNKFDHQMRICLIGDSKVGKTQFCVSNYLTLRTKMDLFALSDCW